LRKSSYEIADLQQTAQIISSFRSSFLPQRSKAGQIDENPVDFVDCTDRLFRPGTPNPPNKLDRISAQIIPI
jgi:hypothetical protein